MQVLTASESRQLEMTAIAAYDALVIVEDTVCHTIDRVLVAATSDRAIAFYRNTWATLDYAARVFVSIAFLSGCVARIYFDAFMDWQAEYVETCLDKEELAIAPVEVEAITGQPLTVTVVEVGDELIVSKPRRKAKKAPSDRVSEKKARKTDIAHPLIAG